MIACEQEYVVSPIVPVPVRELAPDVLDHCTCNDVDAHPMMTSSVIDSIFW